MSFQERLEICDAPEATEDVAELLDFSYRCYGEGKTGTHGKRWKHHEKHKTVLQRQFYHIMLPWLRQLQSERAESRYKVRRTTACGYRGPNFAQSDRTSD